MTGSDHRRVMVVCPTEYGGQIEHAADLALAIAEQPGVERCLLLSRPGAAEYLGELKNPKVKVLETLPRRRKKGSKLQNLLRPARQVMDLVTEHLIIRRLSRAAGDGAQLVLETSKYPVVSLLRAGQKSEVVLFVHNAKPHFDPRQASLRDRVLLGLESYSMRTADRVVTQGTTQAETLREVVGDRLRAVSLPLSSRLSKSQDLASQDVASLSSATDLSKKALCIGELRSNKGIEIAIEAADTAQVPLVIAGKSDGAETEAKLAELAAASEYIVLEDRFLERSEFDRYLESAKLIVLPYVHFDAQSGILAKAMYVKASIFASDLPALRDQAGDYPDISFADHQDPAGFAAGLAEAFKKAQGPRQDDQPEDFSDWDSVAVAVLGGHRKQS
ncbi:glycosyltransferase [Psychromicrobium sp. YIM B11713]|uniref:glycosyltransferase n=1 Tax=Psychromicrobium sp. YIM B11713 TaxID=3145233 RepID=UPI00374E6BB7